MKPLLPLAILSLSLLAGLATVPIASAANGGIEGFENCATAIPQSPDAGSCTDQEYVYSFNNANSFVQTAVVHSGTKALVYNGLAASNYEAMQWTGATGCAASGVATLTSTYNLWIRVDAIPGAGTSDIIGISNAAAGSTPAFGVGILSSGVLQITGQLASQSTGKTVTVNTWFDLHLYASCTAEASGTQYECASSAVLAFSICTAPAAVTCSLCGAGTKYLIYSQGAASPFTRNAWLDDISVSGLGVPETFCSTPTGTNFGYDFKEDVTRDTVEAGITIDPFYHFEGESDDYGFLGKSWGATTPAVTDATSFFRVEAEAEGFASIFRSVFGFVGATGTTAAPVMDKGTGSTAGDTSGDFSEHLEVRLIEGGSSWNIQFRGFSATGGQTIIQPLGPSINIDNPNDPHSYAFRVNTATSMLYFYRVSDNNADIEDSDLTELMSVNFADAGAGWFTGDAIREHWFVGSGDNSLQASTTALDVDLNTNFSTCLYFPAGVNLNGDVGSIPSGESESSTMTTATTGGGQTGGGIDVSDFVSTNIFMGVLLVFGIVWMGIQQGAPGAAIGALMFIGLFLGYAIGWIPLWMIIVPFVLALAAVWFLPKPSNGGMG